MAGRQQLLQMDSDNEKANSGQGGLPEPALPSRRGTSEDRKAAAERKREEEERKKEECQKRVREEGERKKQERRGKRERGANKGGKEDGDVWE